jgi:hypothetical protein
LIFVFVLFKLPDGCAILNPSSMLFFVWAVDSLVESIKILRRGFAR